MPIHRPERTLLRDVPLQFVSKLVRGHGKKAVDVAIPLVPFIDFLIVLVVFLLTSFSASGELVPASVRLPGATHTHDMETAPVLTIDEHVMTLDGRRIADTATLAAQPGLERISPLVNDLETLRANWQVLHHGEDFRGEVIVQADEGVDYRVLKKALFSAAQAGYGNVSFAVSQR